ncbi:MAG TPA: hypothetical protein EYN12_02650 [Deltaproteobacteria bacterium]|nr:hypothetical protein [Deltaproteobacteria bacterium]
MKNIIILLISIFFSIQVSAQTQEVLPTDETSKTNLAGQYIYADSYFKKSKTGVVLKYAPTLTTMFYGWRFVVYNTEKFFIGGTAFTGQMGTPDDTGTLTTAGFVAGYDFTIFDDIYVDWGITAGGAGGKQSGTKTISEGGVIVEPWFGFNYKVGEKTDFNWSTSLFMMPNSKNFNNSLSFNLRVDFVID